MARVKHTARLMSAHEVDASDEAGGNIAGGQDAIADASILGDEEHVQVAKE